jgi:hypothetical protein
MRRRLVLFLFSLVLAGCVPIIMEGVRRVTVPPTSSPAVVSSPRPPVISSPAGESPVATAEYPAATDQERRATELVAKIRSGTAAATDALIEAFVRSGIPVMDDRGQLAEVGGRSGHGYPIYTIELGPLLATGASKRSMMTIASLADALKVVPDLAGAAMGSMIVDGLNRAVTSNDEEVRLWGNLIRELGRSRNAIGANDNGPFTESAELDFIQVSLILRRFASDLAVFEQDLSEDEGSGYTVQYASVHPQISQRPIPAPPAKGPCHFGESLGKAVDVAEWTLARAFEQAMEYLEKHGRASVANYLKLPSVLQPFLDYIKFLAVVASTDIRVHVEHGSLPLKRTKYMHPMQGERVDFVVTAFYDPGSSQWVNCVRLGLASTMGIEFQTPQSGPFSGGTLQILGLKGFGHPSGSEQIVTFFRLVGDPQFRPDRVVIDAQGRALVRVAGWSQSRPIPDSYKQHVLKTAALRILPQFQQADIISDLLAATDVGLTIRGGNKPWDIPAEMLMRTRWVPFDYEFPVLDWGVPGYRSDRVALTVSVDESHRPIPYNCSVTMFMWAEVCGDPLEAPWTVHYISEESRENCSGGVAYIALKPFYANVEKTNRNFWDLFLAPHLTFRRGPPPELLIESYNPSNTGWVPKEHLFQLPAKLTQLDQCAPPEN